MANGINRLRELRLQSGKSQRIVADFIGVTQPRISRFERGDSIPSEYLMLFSELFGVSIDYILCRTEEKKGLSSTAISEDEFKWVTMLRSLSPEQKKLIDGIRMGIWTTINKKL